MKNKNKNFSRLLLRTTFIIFTCLLFSFLIFFTVTVILYKMGYMSEKHGNPLLIILILVLISLMIGSCFSAMGAKRITKPIQDLKKATSEITKGNFDIQVESSENPDIQELIENFNKMTRELKNNETLKTDFISNVSHEFKTPLAIIQSTFQALQNENLDEEVKKSYSEILNKNILKLTNLTSNILNLSKIENQEIVPNKTEFLLDEQIRQCILAMQPEWEKKNIQFDLSLPETKYFGSQELLLQVWQNIIGNAIKFSHQNGVVKIELFKNENFVVKISDDGIGMNEETQSHIFDKFFQGDTSHSKDGNGLGLSLVSRIIKILNGKISVESKLGVGTIFTIVLKVEE